MKISTTKKELQEAFSKLSKATQVKSQNPLVNYTHISANPAGITLHSTDLEVGVKTQISGSIINEGECLCPVGEIAEIVNVLEDGRIDIEVSGSHINIKSEKGISFDLSTVPYQEYPDVPDNKHENLFCIKTKDLKDITSSLLYAINTEPTKPALNGACFNFLEDSVDFVATDGHRLIKISKQNNTNIIGSYIIPKKFLSILISFLENQSETNLIISGEYIFTNNNKDVFYSKIIDEKYPNYNAVIPDENPHILKADKNEMLNSIKATSVAINKSTNQITLNISEGKVFFKCANQPESKMVHAPLKSAEYSGEEISIGFNAVYLKEAVSKYPNNEILFTFKDSSSATLFLPKNNEQKTIILLMPVRINE
tara:strand:- start:70 stop:1176 length:1107 start_codon:yes stop_codon:yes gene_type:complete